MRCWNCNRQVAKKAKVCAHCEADLSQAPKPEEEKAVLEMLQQMPPDALAEMQKLLASSTSAEDFANRIMVGSCPKCGSDETGDCEEDPEIDNLLVGRCYECGQLWCTECDKPLEGKAPKCPCWDEDPGDDLE
jgi:hypothetical protein